jgi:hypothetical protein
MSDSEIDALLSKEFAGNERKARGLRRAIQRLRALAEVSAWPLGHKDTLKLKSLLRTHVPEGEFPSIALASAGEALALAARLRSFEREQYTWIPQRKARRRELEKLRQEIRRRAGDEIRSLHAESIQLKDSLSAAVETLRNIPVPSFKAVVREVARRKKIAGITKRVEASALSWASGFLQPDVLGQLLRSTLGG